MGKTHRKPKVTTSLLVLGMISILFGSLFSITARAALNIGELSWYSETKNIYQDPISGDFIFISVEKERSSLTYYQTQGFVISDAILQDGQPVKSGLGEIRIALADPANASTVEQLGGKMIKTTWIISAANIYEKIAAVSPAWMNKILSADESEEEVRLMFDAIMAVYVNDNISGYLDLLTGLPLIGTTWDLSDESQLEDMKSKYPWFAPYASEHIDQTLTLRFGKEEEEETEEPPQEKAYNFGKGVPDYITWNYNPDGKFNIGDGIPTSEKVRNAYEANKWAGYAIMTQRKGVEKNFTFSGSVSWKEPYTFAYVDEDTGELKTETGTYTKSSSYSHTVKRQVGYWYLFSPDFYDLTDIIVYNEVFPSVDIEDTKETRKHEYIDHEITEIECTRDGVDQKTVDKVNTSYPDDSWHIDWDGALVDNRDKKLNVSAETQTEAKAAFNKMAEDSVLQNEDIKVRNDLLRINGKTYMHSDFYRYGDAGIQKNSYFPAEEEDFGLKEGDSGKAGQGELIPSNTANGKYDTKLVGLYKQLLTTNPKTYKFEKKGEEAIKEEYKSNEPIVVHTPTVASVVIEDPETGEIINGDNGHKNDQLFYQAVNPYVDYQLLLDGTYTIQFNPVTHLEHMGYDIPELVDSLYNKYCKFREVRFPFAVQINGKIYEPDGTGWTEWIDLSLDQSTTISGFEGGDISDLFEVDFYIPPWAEENITDDPNKQTYPDPYIIQYRVAPENIIDHNGVNHIDEICRKVNFLDLIIGLMYTKQ